MWCAAVVYAIRDKCSAKKTWKACFLVCLFCFISMPRKIINLAITHHLDLTCTAFPLKCSTSNFRPLSKNPKILAWIIIQPPQNIQLTLASDPPIARLTKTFCQHSENVLFGLMLGERQSNQMGPLFRGFSTSSLITHVWRTSGERSINPSMQPKSHVLFVWRVFEIARGEIIMMGLCGKGNAALLINS